VKAYTRKASSFFIEINNKNRLALAQFIAPFEILKFDDQAAKVYGEIRADLETKGTIIGPLDTMIAAHALCINATLITNNVKEFSRVKNLVIENWT
jgi:tRNA(fMet)-specific endonuclease VapC